MAGPVFGRASNRAGEEGEYHHSKNLTRKIAVGNNTLSELRRWLGTEVMLVCNNCNNPDLACCDFFFVVEKAISL